MPTVEACEKKLAHYRTTLKVLEEKQANENDETDYSKDIRKAKKAIADWESKLAVAIEVDKALPKAEPSHGTEVIEDIEKELESLGQAIPAAVEIDRAQIIKKVRLLEMANGWKQREDLETISDEELKDYHAAAAVSVKSNLNATTSLTTNMFRSLLCSSTNIINPFLADIGIMIDRDELYKSLADPIIQQQIQQAFSEIFEDDPALKQIAMNISRGFPKLGFVCFMVFGGAIRSCPPSGYSPNAASSPSS
jgi:hypothetical protein